VATEFVQPLDRWGLPYRFRSDLTRVSGVPDCDVGQLPGALARPNDLTCQVCERLCESEERFFRHIHKYHPDYWRVFAGGRPLTDYIQSAPSTSPSSSCRRLTARRDKRFSCGVCGRTFSQVRPILYVCMYKPNSITLASLELTPNMFGASSELVRSWFEAEIWLII